MNEISTTQGPTLKALDTEATNAWGARSREAVTALLLNRQDIDWLLISLRRLQDSVGFLIAAQEAGDNSDRDGGRQLRKSASENLVLSMDSLTDFMNSVFKKSVDIEPAGDGNG